MAWGYFRLCPFLHLSECSETIRILFGTRNWPGKTRKWRLRTVHATKQYTDLTEAYFASKMPCDFTTHKQKLIPFAINNFHETRQCWKALRSYLLQRISPKSDNKCQNYGYKFNLVRKNNTAFSGPNLRKLRITEKTLVEIFIQN